MQRLVFVKMIAPNAGSEIVLAHRELWHRLASLTIPGMPAILDLDEDAAKHFVVTELLDALPLQKVEQEIRRVGGDVLALIQQILAQALETLATLHEAGLVHGDISASNIMVSQFGDRVWLVDPAPPLPNGQLMTAMAWAAPELKSGEQPGPLTDLFALGSLLEAFARRNGAIPPPIVLKLAQANARLRPPSATAARMAFRVQNKNPQQPISAELGAFPWDVPDLGSPPVPNELSDRTTFRSSSSPRVQPNALTTANRHDAFQPANETQQPLATSSNTAWSDRTSIGNVPILGEGAAKPTEADFIVMGPTTVMPGSSFPLELWMGPSAAAVELRERAQERGVLSERGWRSRVTLPTQTLLTAYISLPGFTIANPTEQIAWDGTIRNIAFIVQSAEKQRAGEHWGTIKLLIGTLPLGMVSFCVSIDGGSGRQPDQQSLLKARFQRFRTAFASYASSDRAEVFKRVQAIRASRVDIFSDIAELRGGERWEDALMREIAARDVFYLFWSRKAAESKWVEREWRHAIETRGTDFICPIPLEDPRLAVPPTELAVLHFNDWCLAVIQNEQAIAKLNDGLAEI